MYITCPPVDMNFNSISHLFTAITCKKWSLQLEDKIHIHAQARNILYICTTKASNLRRPNSKVGSGNHVNLYLQCTVNNSQRTALFQVKCMCTHVFPF